MAGGILRGPEQQKGFRSVCRLPSAEMAPLRASRLPSAASPRGLHGPGSLTLARDARAGGGEAATESRGGDSRQLRSCLPGCRRVPTESRLSKPAPEAPGMGWRPGSGARPRLELARRPRAPGFRPGRHLPGLEATSSSRQTLLPLTCTAGRGAA